MGGRTGVGGVRLVEGRYASALQSLTWGCLLFVSAALMSPIMGAVPFSGLTFGVSHGRSLERLLVTGLLYGVAMAFVFARRSWEHAVGAHYMTNMIPTVELYLESPSGL